MPAPVTCAACMRLFTVESIWAEVRVTPSGREMAGCWAAAAVKTASERAGRWRSRRKWRSPWRKVRWAREKVLLDTGEGKYGDSGHARCAVQNDDAKVQKANPPFAARRMGHPVLWCDTHPRAELGWGTRSAEKQIPPHATRVVRCGMTNASSWRPAGGGRKGGCRRAGSRGPPAECRCGWWR